MFKQSIALILVTIFLAACSSVDLGSYTNSPQQSYSTVNGSINIGPHSKIKNASTVNGSIYLQSNISINSASTVNGSISAGESLQVTGSVHTVNGSITFESGSDIGGNIETVNGDINLDSVQVAGDLITVSGDFNLTGKTRIKGDIHINNGNNSVRIKSLFWDNISEVTIGPDVIIDGILHYERKITLSIDPAAQISKIVFSSDLK